MRVISGGSSAEQGAGGSIFAPLTGGRRRAIAIDAVMRAAEQARGDAA